jgi:putative ABC transport system permease protein
MAYNGAQRKHELGVRLALGAARTGIVRIVVTESLRLALTGVGIGAVAALAGGPWISSLLFRQSPRDPAVFAVVTVVLTVVAVAASAIPALRAARLDPKTALQAD